MKKQILMAAATLTILTAVGTTVSAEEITICRASLGTNAVCGPDLSAGATEFFSVQVRTPVRLLFLGEYITGGAVFGKNEQW